MMPIQQGNSLHKITSTPFLVPVQKEEMSAAPRTDFFTLVDPAQKEQARQLIAKMQSKILYSEKYFDPEFEYRHVILPKEVGKLVPRNRLMEEAEWRQLGVQQSVGWRHYMIHKPEPHILLFKRPRTSA
jgi:cyclin-dependent kinase regulatory subunit CKS1